MCNIKARGGCPYMRQWNEPRETHGTNILMICSCKILTLTKSFAEFLLLKNQTKPKKTNKQTKTHTQKPQTHTHTTRKKQNKTKNNSNNKTRLTQNTGDILLHIEFLTQQK